MNINQFALYRVNQDTEGKVLWHLSYQEAMSRKLKIRIEFYKQMEVGKLKEDETISLLWKRMKEHCEVSDVLVLNQEGEISCYYLNEEYPQRLAGFIQMNGSGTLVTLDTENFQIEGKQGNWMAADMIIIDGTQFFLMEHQEYHRQVACVILDSYGKLVADACKNGFDEEAKRKIHDYLHEVEPEAEKNKNPKTRLEHYQKFFENGTYERSWESGTEANYDMVDGQVNNQNRKSGKSMPEKPKKRTSVIKRLREKQIAIAIKSGKPIPKYLNRQMERNRK